jgi:hypothetical protein
LGFCPKIDRGIDQDMPNMEVVDLQELPSSTLKGAPLAAGIRARSLFGNGLDSGTSDRFMIMVTLKIKLLTSRLYNHK